MAAFLGLAVLALLYFSQARDVRRLRDWAGRAPERTLEQIEQGTEVERATEVAPATPAATAATAAAHSLPPTPLRRLLPRENASRCGAGPQRSHPAAALHRDDGPGRAGAGGRRVRRDSADRRRRRRRPRTPGSRRASCRAQSGAPGRWGRRPVPGDGRGAERDYGGGPRRAGRRGGACRRFKLGTIGNAARVDQTSSVVLYRDGQARAARTVANRLGIDKTAQVDSVNEEIAGSFDVIVLVGSDRGG